jgi:hypothetical protein
VHPLPPLTDDLHRFCSYSQRRVTDLRDRDGIRFGLRAFRDRRMDERFMEQLVRRIDEFVTACGIQPALENHARGDFAQVMFGYNHGMGAGNQASKPIAQSLRF